jgi:hypothetical protein
VALVGDRTATEHSCEKLGLTDVVSKYSSVRTDRGVPNTIPIHCEALITSVYFAMLDTHGNEVKYEGKENVRSNRPLGFAGGGSGPRVLTGVDVWP